MAKILLIGMGPTALSALNSLATKFTVLGVIRDEGIESETLDPVTRRARELRVPVLRDTSLAGITAAVAQMRPDCVVVSSYNRIFGPSLVRQCPFVNVHYAPLPRYRGRATLNWALINDEPWAAISIHCIVPELDAGNILFQRRIPIKNTDTVADLYQNLNAIQQDYLAETVAQFLNGYEGIPQDEEASTYVCSRLPEDGQIDWTAATRDIHCLIRALIPPFPGAYTYYQGRRLIICEAEPVQNPLVYEGRIPGRIVRVTKSDGSVEALTRDGTLRISEVQFQGGPKSAASTVIKSVRDSLGLCTTDLWERIQGLEQQVADLKFMLDGLAWGWSRLGADLWW